MVSCCLQFGDFLAWCWDSGICAGVSWCNISCRVIPVLGWVWLFGEFGCFVVILFEWCWFIVPWRVIVWWGLREMLAFLVGLVALWFGFGYFELVGRIADCCWLTYGLCFMLGWLLCC